VVPEGATAAGPYRNYGQFLICDGRGEQAKAASTDGWEQLILGHVEFKDSTRLSKPMTGGK
jgi:hypothetical protein